MNKAQVLLAITLLTAAVLIGGCSHATASAPSATAVPFAGTACAGPVRVVVLTDKTGSANYNRTPVLTPADFNPLFDYVMRCGGDVMTGLISDRSNQPLLRYHAEEPAAEPEPTDPHQNSYRYARRHDAEIRERKRVREVNAQRLQEAKARLDRFRESLEKLLATPAHFGCSDVAGGLRRAALAEGEPDSLWNAAPLKFLVLAGDAQHNCGRRELPESHGVRIIMANGDGDNGIMAGIPGLVRVESFSAATSFIQKEVAKETLMENR